MSNEYILYHTKIKSRETKVINRVRNSKYLTFLPMSTGNRHYNFSEFTITVQIDLMGQLMTTSGGGLKNTYRAKQFHFHWGSEDKRGSEHDINNHHFPMEVHLLAHSSEFPLYIMYL